MRKILFLFIFFAGISFQSEACVDPHPDSLIFNLYVDTTGCDAVIEISNLQIMGGTSNQFCSCGVNSQIVGLGDIVYLVFVDSLTHEPVIGFDQFGLNAFASNEWDLAASSFDWNGFVSDVNEAGLLADQPVELWIRIDLYESIFVPKIGEVNPCDEPALLFEVIGGAAIGTDEWNNDDNELAEDHLSITYFTWNQMFFSVVDESFIAFYDDIVEAYYSALSINYSDKIDAFEIYPNPTNGVLNLKGIPDNVIEGVIYNTLGEIVFRFDNEVTEIDISHLPPGVYQLTVNGIEEKYNRTIIKQ